MKMCANVKIAPLTSKRNKIDFKDVAKKLNKGIATIKRYWNE